MKIVFVCTCVSVRILLFSHSFDGLIRYLEQPISLCNVLFSYFAVVSTDQLMQVHL